MNRGEELIGMRNPFGGEARTGITIALTTTFTPNNTRITDDSHSNKTA